MSEQPFARDEDDLFAQVMQLLSRMEAAAAVGAQLACALEQVQVPPEIAPHLERVAALAAPALASTAPAQQRAVLGAIRAFFRQATELLVDPARAPGWSHTDPALLNEQGRASGAFGPVLAALLGRLGPEPAGTRHVLDVGTGAGWLAVALARALPDAHVVGVDIWPPALDCARANVVAEGLEARVSIHECDVQTLPMDARFDAAWLPGPFLPRALIEAALARVYGALRPGGLVFFGLYAGSEEPLARAITDLRTARSGGQPLGPEQVAALLSAAGFKQAHETPRTWRAPMRLVIGTKPAPEV